MLLEIIVLALSIPLGFLISYLAKDELEEGKKYFQILLGVSAIGALIFWTKNVPYLSLSFGFIFMTSMTSLLIPIKKDKRKL